MNKAYTTIFIFIVLLGCKPQHVDYRPFDKLDMNAHCAVYFICSEGDWDHFEKKNQDFVLNDKNTLQKLKDNWGFTKTNKRMACGYGYLVYITQDNKLFEIIHINEPCGYATANGEWYDFDDNYYDCIDKTKIQKLTKQQADSIQTTLVNQIEK